MEELLELILSILFMPFEDMFDQLLRRINRIPCKAFKIFWKVLLILIPMVCIFGLCCLLNYLFRGYLM